MYHVANNGYDLLRVLFFFQAEDGIRDLVRSRGLGDVYKRQLKSRYLFIHQTHLGPTLIHL